MSFWQEQDIDTMLSGLGSVDVVHGTETGKGLLDSYDEEVLQRGDRGSLGAVSSLLVRTTAFPTLTGGSPITVDGAPFTVRDRLRVDDGALTRLLLKKG